jgi:putative hemolysin
MFSATYEITFILALIVLNGLLAAAEISIVSARKARLQQRINEGDNKAIHALKQANDPSDFLSTVQIGITLVGVLAGAFGGATIASSLAEMLREVPTLAPISGSLSIAIVVIAITYLNLIFGELVPKRLTLNNPEKVAVVAAPPMSVITFLTLPVVRLLSLSTDLVLRIIRANPSEEPSVTEEEVKVMIEQGTQAGIFEEAEQDMLEGVFRLGDLRVGNLITPRTEIDWLDSDAPSEEHQQKIVNTGRSRFPVGQGSLDDVLGVVQAKDLLVAYLAGQSVNLIDNLREPLFVPENMPALKVLELIKETRLPMALVIDEYGGVQGLVTLNDILEAIVGDISVRGETDEPEIVRREDGSWLLDGMLAMDEIAELLRIDEFPGEKEGYYQTLGGFIITFLGQIPGAGHVFEWKGLRFEVMDMDGLRVDKVLVVPQPVEPDLPEQA